MWLSNVCLQGEDTASEKTPMQWHFRLLPPQKIRHRVALAGGRFRNAVQPDFNRITFTWNADVDILTRQRDFP